jgi:hypothetical protein
MTFQQLQQLQVLQLQLLLLNTSTLASDDEQFTHVSMMVVGDERDDQEEV